MTTNELSVGNWVTNENGFAMFVQAIYDDDTVYLDFEDNEADTWETDIEDVHPIPLTEELVQKLGFRFFKGGSYGANYKMETRTDIMHIEKQRSWDHFDLFGFKKKAGYPFRYALQIKYLHELQNAFRLITHQELEVKL